MRSVSINDPDYYDVVEDHQYWLIQPCTALAVIGLLNLDDINTFEYRDGLCNGFAYEALLSGILSGKRDDFKKRLEILIETHPVQLAIQIRIAKEINIYHKKNPNIKINSVMQRNTIIKNVTKDFTPLIQNNQLVLNIIELDRIITHLEKYPAYREELMEIFGLLQRTLIATWANMSQMSIQNPNVEGVSFAGVPHALLDLLAPNESQGISEIVRFSNASFDLPLIHLLEELANRCVEKGITVPVGFLLNNRKHSIVVGYSRENQKPWFAINANKHPDDPIPYFETADAEEIITFVTSALQRQGNYYSLLTHIIYTNQPDEKNIKEIWSELKSNDNTKYIMEVTPEQARFDEKGAYLLYVAAFNGVSYNLAQIIDMTPSPNKPYKGETPLMRAIIGLHIEIVEIMLKHQKIECNSEVLELALESCNKKIILCVLDRLFKDKKTAIIHQFLADEELDLHHAGIKKAIISFAHIDHDDIQNGLFECYLRAIQDNDTETQKFLDDTLYITYQSRILEKRLNEAHKKNDKEAILLLSKISSLVTVNVHTNVTKSIVSQSIFSPAPSPIQHEASVSTVLTKEKQKGSKT